MFYTFGIKFEVKFTETSEISQSTEQYFANITPLHILLHCNPLQCIVATIKLLLLPPLLSHFVLEGITDAEDKHGGTVRHARSSI